MKKTIYLKGLIALSLGSIVMSSCNDNNGRTTKNSASAEWMNTDTIPGKVVHDDRGNEWIWHRGYGGGGLSNMLMGYWLINSMSSGMQTRYYPSSRQYTNDMDVNRSTITRPGHIPATAFKAKEGMINDIPSAAKPINRAAIKSSYAANPSTLRTVPASSNSTRSGFGKTGSSTKTVSS